MIDCVIRLDVRDSQPLARAFTLARGDENAVRLLLRFFDGEEELGQQTGDYATLSLRKFGEETSTDYLLTRADGAYALTVTAAMAASVLSLTKLLVTLVVKIPAARMHRTVSHIPFRLFIYQTPFGMTFDLWSAL